ncbi:hypothetical protein EHU43_23220 [Escherichia coli]|nr:hypothetical protein [Escherichia coli]
MDSVHHIWCPLFSQEFQDLPDGAETTLTFIKTSQLMRPKRSAVRKNAALSWDTASVICI